MSALAQKSASETHSTRINSILEYCSKFFRPYLVGGPFQAAIYLTLITFSIDRPEVHSLVLFCIAALIIRSLVYSSLYWFCITAVFVGTHWKMWYSGDNHWYLLMYWGLAIALCFRSPYPQEALAKSARWMLGIVFLCTVVWKAITPEFMDGRFFEYALLADARFSPVSLLVGLDGETLIRNREILHTYIYASDPAGEFTLTTTPGIRPMAIVLTCWTLAIESAIAIVFLLPKKWISEFWRHGTLLLFLYTTYPIAQVSGFGWTLLAMGMCQLKPSSKPLYMTLYLGSFILIYISKNPGIRGILHHLNIL